VGPAIVASTLTTLVIFLPLVFVRGISGVLFKEMAFVVVYSLLCSLAVAMTLVPMLASKLLRGSGGQRRMRADWLKRLAENCDNAVGKLDNSYRFTLQKVLRRRVATIVAAVSVLAASFLLTPFIGTEFLPPSDEGAVSVSGRMEIGTRLELLDERLRRMEAIVYGAVPETVSTVASIRGERCSIDISLTPTGDRGRSSEEIADDLRGKIEGRVAGVDLRVRVPSGQFVLDRLIDTDESLEIEVRGYDFQVLRRLAKQVEAVIKEVPGVSDVNLRDDEGVPQVEIHLNRNKISDLGLSVRDVTQVLRTAIAGSQAGNFHTSGNAYRILLQLKDAERLTIEEVLDMTLTTPGGEVVALRNLVETSASRAPGEINRRDQQRFVSVGANVAGRDLGSVASDIQEAIDEIPRPTGYDLVVSGDYEEQQKAFRDLTISLMLALLLVS
jgi:HAE1 family hydrophobic/amphiphilic exporter-1